MELGFDTIGNATLIVYDGGPVLVTDPWFEGDAYFGSWGLSHQIPEEQRAAILGTQNVWVSHGHPDHLSGASLALVKDKTILLPDHVGGRIEKDLSREGFRTRVLPEREWVSLSPRVSVMCITDYNQDAILLVKIGDSLVVNLNDASERGWGRLVRKAIAEHPTSFLMALSGHGDADMIQTQLEDGTPLRPDLTRPVGQRIANRLDAYGAKFFVPFSSMHRYQRDDTVWANAFTTDIDAYGKGFASRRGGEMLAPFTRHDALTGECTAIDPAVAAEVTLPSTQFGDDWSEPLSEGDVTALRGYLQKVDHFRTFLDEVVFRVAGKDHVVSLGGGKGRSILFEVPRGSLMTAVQYEVFDDLLIGNFMKTTFRGKWRRPSLYPDFTPYLTKYADNGQARTRREVASYFAKYGQRAPLDLAYAEGVRFLEGLEQSSTDIFRASGLRDSVIGKAARGAYALVRGRRR